LGIYSPPAPLASVAPMDDADSEYEPLEKLGEDSETACPEEELDPANNSTHPSPLMLCRQ
jgi:hypothetical protein